MNDPADSGQPLDICLLAPWYGGSHRRWADGLQQHSRHRIEILSLPDRHWKWRLHGAAVTFAGLIRDSGRRHDLILASDMMDVAVFRSLLRGSPADGPVAVYFHENQLGYPVSPLDSDLREGRDLHYGFINYTSALAADRVFFNSSWHRDSFLGELPRFLSRFPDHPNLETVERIRERSEVLPLGLDLRALEAQRPRRREANEVPLLLWNHRWEYDKRPEAWMRLILDLKSAGLEFEVALLGQRSGSEPPLLGELRKALGPAVLIDGTVEDSAEYASWLWRADILPVTSGQDFFGGSVIEAVYCGCHPWLPRALAYPEHFPGAPVFYDSGAEALEGLARLVASGAWKQPRPGSDTLLRYDWSRLAPRYDRAFRSMA